MFHNNGCMYAVECHARCIEAVVGSNGDGERDRFLVGTTSLKKQNQIQVIEYQEEPTAKLICRKVYTCPEEVWSLAPHPHDVGRVMTSNRGPKASATLWHMDGFEELHEGGLAPTKPLRPLATIPEEETFIQKLLWSPTATGDVPLVSVQKGSIKCWSLNSGSAIAKERGAIAIDTISLPTSGCWDPHSENEVAVCVDTNVSVYDIRSCKAAHQIKAAHAWCARDIDYNPIKPNYIVTGGDDCKVMFWDVRKTAQPLKVLTGHSDWIWSVKYNPHHDQLILSAGSDSLLNLWRVSTISSAPLLETNESSPEQHAGIAPDLCVQSYEDHEDSIYSIAWGRHDPWIFASLSYDGTVALNQVPSHEKYKILL